MDGPRPWTPPPVATMFTGRGLSLATPCTQVGPERLPDPGGVKDGIFPSVRLLASGTWKANAGAKGTLK